MENHRVGPDFGGGSQCRSGSATATKPLKFQKTQKLFKSNPKLFFEPFRTQIRTPKYGIKQKPRKTQKPKKFRFILLKSLSKNSAKKNHNFAYKKQI
jgi:hypothetical protein